MWTANRPPSRPQRTSSVHSIASVHSTSRPTSMTSPQLRRSGYESDQSSDTANDDDFVLQNASFPRAPSSNGMNNMPAMWQSGRQQSGSAVSRLSQKFGSHVQVAEIQAPPPLRTQHQHPQDHDESSPDDDTNSRASTLNDEPDFEFPEKTPTSLPRKAAKGSSASHIAGPLEQQLASLMSKLIYMERENPVVSVTPEDYKELQDRVKALEGEKKTWWKRHEAIWALRDEDVENNIKIRGMLAKDRRALEGMTKLRDDDLVNLQIVRVKLAEATRKIERLESSSGRSSPMRGGRPGSMIFERRDTTDLFAKAKSDALEQRVLELEKRNSELIAQMEHMRMGVSGTAPSASSIDALNSVTAHKAWKETVADLELKVKEKDNQIARLKAGGSQYIGTARSGLERSSSVGPVSSGNGADWRQIDAIHEEHASYREKVGAKMQALRSEKEVLQKDLHRKEDECHNLEVKVQSLQRRVAA